MKRGGRVLGWVLTMYCAVGLLPHMALAVPISARELRARQDFAAGRYDEALEIFAELYAKTADPIFLRNIARCYQKENRSDEAIATFHEYLTKAKKISPSERDEVTGYIRALEANRPVEKTPSKPAAAAAAPAAEPAAPPPAREPVATTSTASTNTVAEPTTVARPPITTVAAAANADRARHDEVPLVRARDAPAGNGGSVSIPGVALTVAGAALVGAGVAFGLAAKSAAKSVAAQYDPDRDAAGRRDATLQWVGYGAGAAAIVAGVIFLVRGPSETDAATTRVGLVPGGALITGTF